MIEFLSDFLIFLFMKKLISFFMTAATCTMAQDSWTFVDFKNPAVRVEGRYSIEGNTLMTAWSGTSFTVAFKGTAIKIKLKSPGSVFNVTVDKKTSVLNLAANQESEHLIAKDLKPGFHTVTVYKRTEAFYGEAHFQGFEILGAPAPEKLPRPKKRRIEFVGNSITCGYGILDTIKEHTFDIATEDASMSYASVAARALNVEANLVCASGRGVYRNFDGDMKETMLPYYDKVSPLSDKLWDFSKWTPDIVLMNLGTNDFATGVPDSAAFTNAVLALIQKIRAYYPKKTPIVLMEGPLLSDYHPPVPKEMLAKIPADYFHHTESGHTFRSLTICQRFLDSVRDHLIASGDSQIYRFTIPAQDGTLGYGADYHPSSRQAAHDGKLLADWISKTFKWIK